MEMLITVGQKDKKKILQSQQFHIKYGEPFVLQFRNKDDFFRIRFTQKIDPPQVWLLPFKDRNQSPRIETAKEQVGEDICYELVNFNQIKVATNPIPFYTKEPSGHYYFQISAMSISSEINNVETIWLYTVTIYEDE